MSEPFDPRNVSRYNHDRTCENEPDKYVEASHYDALLRMWEDGQHTIASLYDCRMHKKTSHADVVTVDVKGELWRKAQHAWYRVRRDSIPQKGGE